MCLLIPRKELRSGHSACFCDLEHTNRVTWRSPISYPAIDSPLTYLGLLPDRITRLCCFAQALDQYPVPVRLWRFGRHNISQRVDLGRRRWMTHYVTPMRGYVRYARGYVAPSYLLIT